MNYYRRYCGDYLKKTATLSLMEHGAYTLLLDHCYSTDQALPLDRADIYRVARASSKPERVAVDKVLARFWRETPDGYVNERCAEELAKSAAAIDAARTNGKKGGRPVGWRKRDYVPQGTLAKNNPAGYLQDTRQDRPDNPVDPPVGDILQPPTTNHPPDEGEAVNPANGFRTGLALDWAPDELCLSALAINGLPSPPRHVIAGFIGHYANNTIEDRLIPSMFLKWCARQRGFEASRPGRQTDDESLTRFLEKTGGADAHH